jgi:predicted enzyme related to lactoylglutathione lyase
MLEHSIVHVEIAAQDPQAVSRFYSELFGWQLQSIPSLRYIRFQSAGGQTGGFVEPGGPLQHQPGELLVYVGSDDIAADLGKAEQLGGKILVPKTEIPNTGWFGIFQDPAGNRLGLFQRTGYVTG